MNSLPATHGGSRPLLRAARQLSCDLARPTRAASDALADPVEHLLRRQDHLQRHWRLLRAAERRGWPLAAGRLREELLREAGHVRDRAADLTLRGTAATTLSLSSLRPDLLPTLLGELRQLGDEFESVEFDLKQHVLAAVTPPVVLAGLSLGPFRIELHARRLRGRPDVSAFRCVAVEPNAAACDEDVTHPHVKGEGLCAGDATVPIGLALAQGRICDAFCLVRAVLNHYNPQSPYVSVDDWDGVRCGDCDRLTGRDDLSFCDHCDRDVCSDCDGGGCDLCDRSCCRGCLDSDPVSGLRCCPNCRHTCDDCGRTVDADHIDPETDLCPQCHEQRQQDESDPDPDDDDESPPPEETHEPERIEGPDHAGIPAATADTA